MSDTTHNDAFHDDGFHEIQLSGKQLVAIFMATTVVAVVIFLCGVQVGRNVKGDRLASGEPSDTAAANTAAPPPASTPTQAAPSSGPPSTEPPAPAPEPDDELSYAKRLQAAEPAANEKIAPKPQPAPPAAAATPIVATKPPAAAPAAADRGNAAAPSAGRAGSWIVQLAAIQDRGEAANIARRLAGKGYPAFVLDPAAGAPVIYRVQVGGYPDHDKAEQAARKLEKEEHFKPYVRSR